jgi:hypothetical protein
MAFGIINSGETIIRANGAIRRDGMAIADEITTDDMTGITIGVMFVMTTAGTTTSRRFDRISKAFAMHAMKSDKAAGSYAGIIRN